MIKIIKKIKDAIDKRSIAKLIGDNSFNPIFIKGNANDQKITANIIIKGILNFKNKLIFFSDLFNIFKFFLSIA
jgi:hypothetical protein